MWRAYKALVKAYLATALEYRAQVIIWLLSFLFPLVMMTVWLTIVDEIGPAAGWNRTDFISYYVGITLVRQATSAWTVWAWNRDIRTGQLSVKLLKPLNPFHNYLCDQLGFTLFLLTIIVPPVALVMWLSPSISYALTLGRLVAFVISIGVGFMLNVLAGSTFGVLAFWSPQTINLFMLWYGSGQFLSGWIAPLALFPVAIRRIAFLLPFRSSLGFPMEILMGQLTWGEIWAGFAVGGVWMVLLLVAYRILYRLGLRRYSAVGA